MANLAANSISTVNGFISNLTMGGGVFHTLTYISSDTVIQKNHHTLIVDVPVTGHINITLPALANNEGRILTFHVRTVAGGNNAILNTNSASEFIGTGVDTSLIILDPIASSAGDFVTIMACNTNWIILQMS